MATRKEELERYIREHIARAREQAGMTQEELGKAIGKTNVSVSDIERGRVAVSSVDLINIAKALDQPLNFFVPRPARIRIPEEELTTDETKLIHDYRRIIYADLNTAVVNMVEQLAKFSDKSEPRRLVEEYGQIFKELTGKD